MPVRRPFLTPEVEAEIRADERRKVAEELSAVGISDKPEPLTIEQIKRMTPEQVLDRKDEVDRVVAAWDGSPREAS